jgi:hypothetical protein
VTVISRTGLSYETVPESLDEYRAGADRFSAELLEAYYLHFAGLKPTLELAPIYERHRDLTELETCQWLAAEAEGSRPLTGAAELWRFACEGYLGDLTREHEERVAELEASLTATVDGEEIGFRMLRPLLANEPDRSRRESLDTARRGLVERINPIHEEALETVSEGVQQLGSPVLRKLYERFGFPLEQLGEKCSTFLADTEALHAEAFDRLLRARIGIPLVEAARWDVPRALRAPSWDDGFPAGRMVAALETTLDGLGIDLRAQRNVALDLDERPTKSPRAFCAPIEVPARVVLVIQPTGGLDDWAALFHEAGHTEHFAHASAHLPVEARRLGDNAVTEGYAFLLEHLVTDPAWLTRRLDIARPDELAAESGAILLYFVRRYAAKLLYELELHSGADPAGLADRYVELQRTATMIEPAAEDYLADVDPGFYCTSYLRAWALEAQLSEHLRASFGRPWFAERKAGSLLRELWSEGQGLDADTLAREVTGSELAFDAIAGRIAEHV